MRLLDGLPLLLGLAITTAQAASPPPPTVPVAAISASGVQQAASAVAADPLMPGLRMEKTLRLKRDTERKAQRKDDASVRWWADLFEQLSTGLRLALWLIGAGLLIAVLLRLRAWLASRGASAPALGPLPTHVGSLDIRPESLPADLGAAAWRLWQSGQPRQALSLLYRGALSRLVHAHAVPIRAASTESECLRLAAARLHPAAQAYLAELVAGWQTVAYAQRPLTDAAVEALCQGFDARLGPAA